MNVAVLGLGLMGLPMSANLARAGFAVRAWNRSPRELPDLPGLHLAASVREACTGADVVLTMLPDLPQVDEVCAGADGVFAAAPDATLLVMGTVSPTALREWAERSPLRVVDAPVSGGDVGARDGTLSIMVGAQPEDLERVRPVLAALGTTIRHLGPVGAGQLAKACNQVVVATTLTALGEAVALGRAGGLDVEVLLELLGGGLAGSRALEVKRERLVARSFAPGGRADFQHKDLGFAVQSARALGVYLPVTAVVDQLFGAMRWTGHGGDDHSGVVQMIERLSRD
jgi:2-hydroxy-3-oxopropionate reductase